MANYSVVRYGKEWAIFCATSRCYVLFGKKSVMIDRCKQLNEGSYKEQLAAFKH